MDVRKLIDLLTAGAGMQDQGAASILGKSASNYSIFRKTAKDLKLSDLITLCSAAGYSINITGHGLSVDPAALLVDAGKQAAQPGQPAQNEQGKA